MTRAECDRDRWVVIVDDDPVARAALEVQFASASIRSRGFGCALDAIDAISRSNEDVRCVIVDFELPDMKGDQLAAAIQGLCELEGRPSLQIVVVSASFSVDSRRRCLKAGALAVLIKPVKFEELSSLINLEADGAAPTLMCFDSKSKANLKFLSQRLRPSLSVEADELALLCAGGDRDGIAQMAHRVAGSAAVLGWSELHRAAMATELAVKSLPTVPVNTVQRLVAEMRRGLSDEDAA